MSLLFRKHTELIPRHHEDSLNENPCACELSHETPETKINANPEDRDETKVR